MRGGADTRRDAEVCRKFDKVGQIPHTPSHPFRILSMLLGPGRESGSHSVNNSICLKQGASESRRENTSVSKSRSKTPLAQSLDPFIRAGMHPESWIFR